MTDLKITEWDIQVTENTIDQLNGEERKRYLRIGLERLDPEEKALLEMYYYNDFSMEEISSITSLTVSNVKVKIHRTRRRLLEELRYILKDELSAIL